MIFQYMDKDLKKKKNSLFSYIVDSRKVPKDIYMHHNKFNFCIYKKKKKKLYIKTVRNYPLIFIGYAVIKISFSFGKFSSWKLISVK